jgi:hypothetical protein
MRDVRTIPEWRTQLKRLSVGCGTATADEGADWLRLAYRLLLQAPRPQGVTLPDYTDFLALIAAPALENGALSLLPQAAGYMVSRGPTGTCIASVILPGDSLESTAQGDTVALALLGAYAAALLRWNDTYPLGRVE